MGQKAAQTACVSMTGFAARSGRSGTQDWQWDIRSVNGKGLDLRLRLPEIEGLEVAVRAAVGRVAARGNLSLTLRLSRSDSPDALRLSPEGLRAALSAIAATEAAARARGVALDPPRATDILSLRGVIEQGPPPATDMAPLRAVLLDDLDALLDDFAAMRRAEGVHLGRILAGQIDRIEALVAQATAAAEARRPEVQAALSAALVRVSEAAPGADPARIAQELALLAVKADVTEELDRLRAHVAAARALLAEAGPVGRKFDFLTQEFVREANTLCSKSGSAALTAIGLDLKQAIDQMREQVQNVE